MPTQRQQLRRSSRLARRVLTIALAGLLGLGAAALLAPTLRRHLVVARLDAADPTTRARALEAALPLARVHAHVRYALLDALVGLVDSGDDLSHLQARVAAGWLLRNADPFRELIEHRLDSADPERFVTLATLLHMTGFWDVPARTPDDRLRWLTHRYDTDPDRAATIRALARLGRYVDPRAEQLIERAATDVAPSVRRAAVEHAPVVLGEAALSVLGRCLQDDDPAVRARACLMLSPLQPSPKPQAAVRSLLADPVAAPRRAALWTLGRWPDPDPHRVAPRAAELLASDPSATVRAAAARLARDNDALLAAFAATDDVMVRARCLRSLRPPYDDRITRVLRDVLRNERKYWVVMAAATAARPLSAQLQEALLRRLEACLAAGENDLAAICATAWAASRDAALLPLMRDLVTRYRSRPWLAVAGAHAAYRIDRDVGRELLLDLLTLDHAAARDRAVAELAFSGDDPSLPERLRERLRSSDSRLRGAAALALAIHLHTHRRTDAQLLEYLRDRTDPDDPRFESRAPLRGYYLAARLVLTWPAAPPDSIARTPAVAAPSENALSPADHPARSQPSKHRLHESSPARGRLVPRLVDMMTAGAVPPTTASLALTVVGHPAGLNTILVDASRMPPGFDARTFLCDDRFAEILAELVPGAPLPSRTDDPELQSWLVDRLRDWWRVKRCETVFSIRPHSGTTWDRYRFGSGGPGEANHEVPSETTGSLS